MNNKIIAVLGLPGSGKSEVINYLVDKYGWPKVYFGEVTFDELARRGLEVNETNERMVREDLRKKFGIDHYAKKTAEKVRSIDDGKTNILVESLYSWREYQHFAEIFGDRFVTVAVYSSPTTRYARLGQRAVRPLTPEEAQSRDYAQIENLFQAGPVAMADHTLINEGTLGNLYAQIEKIEF